MNQLIAFLRPSSLFNLLCSFILIILVSSSFTWAQDSFDNTTVSTSWTPEELHTVGTAASAQQLEYYIRQLADFGTRHTLSDTVSNTRGIGAARRWIKAEFEKISEECGGCLEVFYVSGIVGPQNRIPVATNVVNVVAIQRGYADPNRFVVMSGDIDSRVSDPTNGISDSPGANDNASGMAGAIEAARILSTYQFPSSIIYTGLSGEEQGLLGGKILADYAIANEWDIKGVLNNDMIGNIKGINGVIDNTTARVFSEGTRYVETEREARMRRFTGGEVDSPSRNLARYVDLMADQYIPNLDVMMIYRLDRFGRGGHHRPFNEVGNPAVRIMETNENYVMQHQDIRVEDGIKYGERVLEDTGVCFDDLDPEKRRVRPTTMYPVVGFCRSRDSVTITKRWLSMHGTSSDDTYEIVKRGWVLLSSWERERPATKPLACNLWAYREAFLDWRRWRSGRFHRIRTRCKNSSGTPLLAVDITPYACLAASINLGLPYALFRGEGG